ncbi:hypothetical protein BDP27DRAFT_1359733 [Rhodocollybia butyracea]|uniref:Uncharacterized protein n=1 Tax=Rhodocollybia butyracea TaxID=206335 RepID=A0A9P5UCK0_9AGAR|nr:hypothetical protein BDP27DRAFT_1359733 [Rhodocollybia butyracea]
MADLTVLTTSSYSLPLYPLSGASRSSFFTTYVPGASSSKVNLVATNAQESRKGERPPRLVVQGSRRGSDSDEENRDGARSPSTDDEGEADIESPESDTVPVPSNSSSGWNRSGNGWHLDPAAASTSPDSTPTPRGRTRIQQHRPSRSRSAPPIQTTFSEPLSKPFTAAADQATFDFRRRYTSSSIYSAGTDSGHSSPSSSFSSPPSSFSYGHGKTKNGDLLRPPPPLHRPTTFWRHTPRSGVTSSSYSPSSHLVRRSTFVAAGLSFDRPMADLSALGVESRVGQRFDEDNAQAKVSDVFFEVWQGR